MMTLEFLCGTQGLDFWPYKHDLRFSWSHHCDQQMNWLGFEMDPSVDDKTFFEESLKANSAEIRLQDIFVLRDVTTSD